MRVQEVYERLDKEFGLEPTVEFRKELRRLIKSLIIVRVKETTMMEICRTFIVDKIVEEDESSLQMQPPPIIDLD